MTSKPLSRREFFEWTKGGLGGAAVASLIVGEGMAAPPIAPQYAPKAKRVIFLCMAGGPSHLETFDHKPTLAKMHGQAMPESITKGQPIAQLQGTELKCLGPQWDFAKYGKSGQEISAVFPHISKLADDMAIVRSMTTK